MHGMFGQRVGFDGAKRAGAVESQVAGRHSPGLKPCEQGLGEVQACRERPPHPTLAYTVW